MIGIFDSGIGGLSIVQSLVSKTGLTPMAYLSDNAFYPYGLKTEEQVINRTSKILPRFVSQFEIEILIIACNTASTVALPTLRNIIDIPIVGVVPAIKPAAAISKSKHIGLLATPATVKRPYTHQLINDFAADCTVHMCGTTKLVDLAEAKLAGKNIDINNVKSELTNLINESRIDTVVLGCTHFPHLLNEISQVFSAGTRFLDSGDAIASRVMSLHKEFKKGHGSRFYYTAPPENTADFSSFGFTERLVFAP